MHKLMEYLCDELSEIERKAEKDNKLSISEIEYADKLLNMKKNLLKAEEMYEDSEFNMDSSYARGMNKGGRSYARRGRGGRRGGANQYGPYSMEDEYSRDSEMINELRELMHDAPNEQAKQEFHRFITKMENMM